MGSCIRLAVIEIGAVGDIIPPFPPPSPPSPLADAAAPIETPPVTAFVSSPNSRLNAAI